MYITFISLDLSCGAYQLTTVEFLANVVKFPPSRKEKAKFSFIVTHASLGLNELIAGFRGNLHSPVYA